MNKFDRDKKQVMKDVETGDPAISKINLKYDSKYRSEMDDLEKEISGREFKYDVNGDALYQQYRDNYINMGDLAARDMMGKAAAMTGGYANSYAQTVGQQVYQGYLNDVNAAIPDFYQAALDRYTAEGQELMDRYNMLAYKDELDYSRHREEVDDYLKMLSAMSNSSGQTEDSKVSGTKAPITWRQTGILDDDGNPIWITSEGKTQAFGNGYNPYTGTINPDVAETWDSLLSAKPNTFENGYQPDNVGGVKLTKTSRTEKGTGKPIYESADGKYYVWHDDLNEYEQVEPV